MTSVLWQLHKRIHYSVPSPLGPDLVYEFILLVWFLWIKHCPFQQYLLQEMVTYQVSHILEDTHLSINMHSSTSQGIWNNLQALDALGPRSLLVNIHKNRCQLPCSFCLQSTVYFTCSLNSPMKRTLYSHFTSEESKIPRGKKAWFL